jgi:hypothetical protein
MARSSVDKLSLFVGFLVVAIPLLAGIAAYILG